MLKMAEDITLYGGKSKSGEPDKPWTPDQPSPILAKMAKENVDSLPDYESFAMTFARVGSGGATGIDQKPRFADEEYKRKDYGTHLDGTKRDAMEDPNDCAEGYCALCK